ncbi:MAG: hypothetical protein QG578_12 [Thermodesulfobacteriota bacterium]|nr:hypothetical protein [Thermodesulfobacteriota bacterium]
MENPSLYNSRIIKNYIEYLNKFHPEIDAELLLKDAGISLHQVEDGGYWFTQEQSDLFNETLVAKTGDVNISRKAGQYAPFSKASGAVAQYLLGFINTRTAYSVLEKLYPQLSRASVIIAKNIDANRIEIDAVPKEGVIEKPYQCDYRLGIFEAIAKLFTTKYADIEHTMCIHKGADACRYIIAWKETPAFIWKRLTRYAILISLILLSLLPVIFQPHYWISLTTMLFLIVVIFYSYSMHLEKNDLLRNINAQGDAAERLLGQINQRYKETTLVKEIGQATSMIPDIDKLLSFIMALIEKHLEFDRGMIMLADREKRHLIYKAGFGYNPDMITNSEEIKFHINKPESKSVVMKAFREQKPYLVDDINKIESDFSERSRSIVKQTGAKSFICVPIVFEKESLGVLMVDNINSKKVLVESDMSLLMGIATQIAASITNAASLSKIREREERFRALSENAPDIIYTLNTEGACTYVNPAWERILGHPKEAVLGRNIIDFVKQEDVGRVLSAFNEIRESRKRVTDLYGTIMHTEGSEHMFHMSGAPNTDSTGNVTGVVGTLKDVTDLKKSEADLRISIQKQKSMVVSTIEIISNIVESRDPYTAGHQKRVADLAVAIAIELGYSNDRVESIRMGSLIHDIGKIHIPVEILSKPGKLSDIEFKLMKTHPSQGYDILKKADFIPVIATMVHQHHERINGSGYPFGIKGDEILPESRILAVADTVEAMASHRPYRASLGINPALDEIKKGRGYLYDADMVDACLRLFEEKSFNL